MKQVNKSERVDGSTTFWVSNAGGYQGETVDTVYVDGMDTTEWGVFAGTEEYCQLFAALANKYQIIVGYTAHNLRYEDLVDFVKVGNTMVKLDWMTSPAKVANDIILFATKNNLPKPTIRYANVGEFCGCVSSLKWRNGITEGIEISEYLPYEIGSYKHRMRKDQPR